MLFQVCSVILLGAIVRTDVIYTPIVQTENGPVRGEILKTVRKQYKYASFKGIPFAEPPIGYLRFKPPIEKKNWTDILNVIEEGNVCIQYQSLNSTLIGSEDCLFLNVFTPHTNLTDLKKHDLKAVMVWIYGGAFTEGYSNTVVFGPDYLLEDDVIVVSMNYRLGPFGFLNLYHENATGNAGLKDQTLALKWVNKNIEKFGGDPKKVTIFGQSAGAVSVDFHVLSEMSTGLFNNSISMSGSSLCLYWSLQSSNEAEKNAFSLGKKLGIKTTSKDKLLQVLYEAPAEEIILKASKMSMFPFRPTIEDPSIAKNQEKFLTQCSVYKYKSGQYNKGPHMMGFTSSEAISLVESGIVNLALRGLNMTNIMIPSNNLVTQQLSRLKELAKLKGKIFKNLIMFASDFFFITGIDSKQKLLYKHNQHSIYYYRFSFEMPSVAKLFYKFNKYNITGVGHTEDLAYLFYIHSNELPINNPEYQMTVNRYVRLMTNFAKYSNPTPIGTNDPVLKINWPDSGKSGLLLEIDRKLSVRPRPLSKNVKFLEFIGLGDSPTVNHCPNK